MKWIGRPLAEIWPFEIFQNVRSLVGRRSLVAGLSSIHIYIYILLLTLISYTPLHYVRNVSKRSNILFFIINLLGPKSKISHGSLMQNIDINMREKFHEIGRETIEP